MKTRIGATAACCGGFFWAAAASAAANGPCSSDTFALEGTALTITVCPAASVATAGKPVAGGIAELVETVSVKGRPALTRAVRYERLPNEETARTLDDVPLAALGIERTMHVTLAVRNGDARLEHALLVPGAIALK